MWWPSFDSRLYEWLKRQPIRDCNPIALCICAICSHGWNDDSNLYDITSYLSCGDELADKIRNIVFGAWNPLRNMDLSKSKEHLCKVLSMCRCCMVVANTENSHLRRCRIFYKYVNKCHRLVLIEITWNLMIIWTMEKHVNHPLCR